MKLKTAMFTSQGWEIRGEKNFSDEKKECKKERLEVFSKRDRCPRSSRTALIHNAQCRSTRKGSHMSSTSWKDRIPSDSEELKEMCRGSRFQLTVGVGHRETKKIQAKMLQSSLSWLKARHYGGFAIRFHGTQSSTHMVLTTCCDCMLFCSLWRNRFIQSIDFVFIFMSAL